MVDDPPTVGYDAGYTESHGVDPTTPERRLWAAVIGQATIDLFSPTEQIRQAAAAFFKSEDLPLIMALAGMSRDEAPWLRRQVLELVEAAQATPTGPGKHIKFKGETRTMTEWSRIIGISVPIIHHRLRRGWSIEETLSTPNQQLAATAA